MINASNNNNSFDCVIVDHDETSREAVAMFCENIKEFEIDAQYSSGEDFLYEYSTVPDLLFLNIVMPGVDGFEILDSLNGSPMVVVMAGDERYAYKSYEFNVVDFLLKPITKTRFFKTVTKVRAHSMLRQIGLSKSIKNGEYLFIKKRGVLQKVAFDDILYIQSKSEYLNIVTRNEHYLRMGSLKDIMDWLPNSFLRVHRSYIINLDRVDSYSDRVLNLEGSKVPVSKTYQKNLLNRIDVI